MGRVGVPEIIVILLIIIILFGAKKLPEIAHALGRALKEFRKAGKESKDDEKEAAGKRDNAEGI